MTFTKKLLVTLFTTVMLTICFGTTAFAAELTDTEVQTVLNSTEATINLDGTSNYDNTDNNIGNNDTQAQDVITEGSTEDEELALSEGYIIDEQGELILAEGYYIDEQGQVYYDETSIVIEEPVIVETPEEEAEEVKEEIEVIKEEKKEAPKTEKEVEVKKPSYSEEDLRLLACLVYAEAGNQSYKGMLGVANVVLNRAKSDVYWHVDTVEEVIYDHKWSVQFAVTIKSKKTGLSMLDKALKCYDTGKYTGGNPEAEKKAMTRAIKAAKAALEGTNNIGDYLCFQNKRSASRIKKKYSDTLIIGDHIFYRTK
jgi:spore germination cell wall hydrolase CwlJ-like protein